jgi:hypothetical protein
MWCEREQRTVIDGDLKKKAYIQAHVSSYLFFFPFFTSFFSTVAHSRIHSIYKEKNETSVVIIEFVLIIKSWSFSFFTALSFGLDMIISAFTFIYQTPLIKITTKNAHKRYQICL